MTIQAGGMVVFELSGRMAHFRKIHTNSSSLTYLLPPRTTLSGIVAAILGLERDTYYEHLGPTQARLTASLRTPVRTVIQTMNNLFVKSPSEVSGGSGHTQVPTELVVPEVASEQLVYRVYFSHADQAVMETLAGRVAAQMPAYPISLGTAPMLASIRLVEVLAAHQLERIPPGVDLSLMTPCLMEDVLGWTDVVDPFGTGVQVIKDLMPYSFGPGRSRGWNREFLVERKGQPLPVRLRCQAWRLTYENQESEMVAFAEDGGSAR
ncbi:CRISPR-associated protein Cas5 [Alicyclobacillus cycloheptanicus]|uniref:CRISPR-associated protein Cas5h n=1 Tax=Alicyclobacillus cycloheptanicus TaxID=1457 RepID=A0ABT9XLW4_9BACL|nr:CRISPR-associated protein Cas5 [Alicyclobacillus cycloheptanicus]MDQ0191304.1 CRISPR-associated protein Cas5h [Alicyclobacillus cycloheptanicus]WDM02421.1 CRISPR-associated protein Cas5 [Alicyclobacillus cycloheptanicus]